MNKHLIVIGTAVLLLVVGLSGCTDNVLNPEMNGFVGTWKYEYEFLGGTVPEIITFFSDGTCTGAGYPNYEIKDGKLVFIIYSEGNEMQFACDYIFSDNDNTLSLTTVGSSNTKVYTKQ